MSSTKICKLSEVITIQNGYAFASKKFTAEEGMPLIRIRDLKNGITTQTKYSGDFDESYLVKSGDLLIGMDGEFKCYEWKGSPALLNQRVCRIQNINETFDLKYLYYGINSYLKAIEDVTGYTTVKHLSSSTILDIEFPIPSLEKQRDIVKKLDSAFAEIDSLEANLELSDDKANQLLQSLLSTEYTLAGIPVVPLEKLVDILDNQRIPVNSTERLQRLGNVPYYGATGQVGTIDKAIFNETLILLGEDGVPFFDSTKHKAYEISGPAWVNNHAHVLRAKPEMVIQRYLLHFLNVFNYTGYVNGATRLKLTQGDMKRIPVPHPNMETQEKIVQKIDSAFEGIKNLTKQINQKKDFALALRQSLLSNHFIQEEAVV